MKAKNKIKLNSCVEYVDICILHLYQDITELEQVLPMDWVYSKQLGSNFLKQLKIRNESQINQNHTLNA